MFKSLFGGAIADVTAAYGRFKSKEVAEGVVAIMVGTSNADGDFEPAEKAKFLKAMDVNPVLKQFDKSVLLAKARELQDLFDFDTDTGIDACMKELREAAKGAEEEQRIAIARMGVAAAKADGDLEDAEVAFLRKAVSALDLSPSQVGL